MIKEEIVKKTTCKESTRTTEEGKICHMADYVMQKISTKDFAQGRLSKPEDVAPAAATSLINRYKDDAKEAYEDNIKELKFAVAWYARDWKGISKHLQPSRQNPEEAVKWLARLKSYDPVFVNGLDVPANIHLKNKERWNTIGETVFDHLSEDEKEEYKTWKKAY